MRISFIIQDDCFNDTYLTTIGVDFRFRTLPIDKKNVKLQIWDTAGQERFRTITNAYYKGADGIIVVYDSTNQQSFEDIEKYWMTEIENYAEKDVELVLIGNKSDSSETKVVDPSSGQEYAQKKNMEFFECSAKTAEGVNKAFSTISRKLMEKKSKKLPPRNSTVVSARSSKRDSERVKLNEEQDSFKLDGCCPS